MFLIPAQGLRRPWKVDIHAEGLHDLQFEGLALRVGRSSMMYVTYDSETHGEGPEACFGMRLDRDLHRSHKSVVRPEFLSLSAADTYPKPLLMLSFLCKVGI